MSKQHPQKSIRELADAELRLKIVYHESCLRVLAEGRHDARADHKAALDRCKHLLAVRESARQGDVARVGEKRTETNREGANAENMYLAKHPPDTAPDTASVSEK